MGDLEITVATPADRAGVVGSLVAAFAADPVLRYLFPEDDTYPRHAAAFFGQLFDKRVGHGTVWTAGRGAAVAMWDAPAATGAPAPPSGGTLAASLPPGAMARVDAYGHAVDAALPAGPFWYLGVLGTHPLHAGQRLGRAVMAAGLARAAEDGLPAILETSNADNVEIYRRAGWTVVNEAASGPLTIWVMRWSAAHLR